MAVDLAIFWAMSVGYRTTTPWTCVYTIIRSVACLALSTVPWNVPNGTMIGSETGELFKLVSGLLRAGHC